MTLDVYDVQGRKIRMLVDAEQSTGPHRVTWDGRNRLGQRVASGVYFYRLETGGQSRMHKMTLIE